MSSAVAAPLDAVIRPMLDDDLPALRELAAVAWDREPIQRAALVDLLYKRPRSDPSLRLVATLAGTVVGLAFGLVQEAKGYVDAIAVDAAVRRRRVATTLLAALEENMVLAGATSLGIGDHTWYYAWPGVDVAYTAALGLAERRGYRRRDVVQSMDVGLHDWVPGSAQRALDRHDIGATVRRAELADWPGLEQMIATEFDETWRHETEVALHRERPTAFVATADDRFVGFACHGVYRTDWFGPTATIPDYRGGGIGEALLRLCLDDMAAAGIATATINWIGPMSFYSRSVGARCSRQFLTLDKDISAPRRVRASRPDGRP